MPQTVGRSLSKRIPFVCYFVVAIVFSVPAVAGSPPPNSKAVRAVYFDLEEMNRKGVLDPAEPLILSAFLTGRAIGRESVVAIFEGKPFGRRLVPMQPTPDGKMLRSIVTLEPYFSGFASSKEKALRVKATFARLRGMKLKQFLSRIVYVTLGLPDGVGEVDTASLNPEVADPEDVRSGERQSTSEAPSVKVKARITEKDIIDQPGSDALAGQEEIYWRQISHLITRSWTGPANSESRMKGKGTVQIRFKLHSNGEAQLIQVERSSGRHDVDEAGLKAILDAHPFPPFPQNLPYDSIDLHVELSRTAKATPRAVRPTTPRAVPSPAPSP